jgi:hypothetical protein
MERMPRYLPKDKVPTFVVAPENTVPTGTIKSYLGVSVVIFFNLYDDIDPRNIAIGVDIVLRKNQITGNRGFLFHRDQRIARSRKECKGKVKSRGDGMEIFLPGGQI